MSLNDFETFLHNDATFKNSKFQELKRSLSWAISYEKRKNIEKSTKYYEKAIELILKLQKDKSAKQSKKILSALIPKIEARSRECAQIDPSNVSKEKSDQIQNIRRSNTPLFEFGVSGVNQLFDHLEKFCDGFEFKIATLQFLNTLLKQVLEMLGKKMKAMMDREDQLKGMLDKIFKNCKKYIDEQLLVCMQSTQYQKKTEFQLLLEVLLVMCQIYANIPELGSLEQVPHLHELLATRMKSIIQEFYEAILTEESLSRDQIGVWKASQVQRICSQIEQNIGNLTSSQNLLQKYINVDELSATFFSDLFSHDLTNFCQLALNKDFSPDEEKQVFDLISKMTELNEFLKSKMENKTIEPIPMCAFSSFITRWIKHLKVTFQKWVLEACKNEKWHPIEENHFFSSSVLDMFCMMGDSVNIVKMYDYCQDSQDKAFMSTFTEVVRDTISFYVKTIFDSFGSELPEKQREKFSHLMAYSQITEKDEQENSKTKQQGHSAQLKRWHIKKPKSTSTKKGQETKKKRSFWKKPRWSMRRTKTDISITPQMCTKIGNIEFARIQLDELVSQNEEDVGSFSETFSYLRSSLNTLILVTVQWLGEHCRRETAKYIVKKKTSHLQHLVAFLDQQLSLIYNSSSEDIFKRFLKGLWNQLVQDITNASFVDEKLKETRKKYAKEEYYQVKHLFCAEGEGLSEAYLKDNILESLL